MRPVDAKVPIVLSSRYSEQQVFGDFMGRGLEDSLPKPYVRSRFEEVLRKALARR